MRNINTYSIYILKLRLLLAAIVFAFFLVIAYHTKEFSIVLKPAILSSWTQVHIQHMLETCGILLLIINYLTIPQSLKRLVFVLNLLFCTLGGIGLRVAWIVAKKLSLGEGILVDNFFIQIVKVYTLEEYIPVMKNTLKASSHPNLVYNIQDFHNVLVKYNVNSLPKASEAMLLDISARIEGMSTLTQLHQWFSNISLSQVVLMLVIAGAAGATGYIIGKSVNPALIVIRGNNLPRRTLLDELLEKGYMNTLKKVVNRRAHRQIETIQANPNINLTTVASLKIPYTPSNGYLPTEAEVATIRAFEKFLMIIH